MKDGIEGLPDVVLNIGDVLDRGRVTNPLPRNHIKVPYMFGGAFVVLLAHENLGGRILEPANKLVTMFRPKVGLEDTECKVKSVSRFLFPGEFIVASCVGSEGLFSSGDRVAWSALTRFSIASIAPSLWDCKLLALCACELECNHITYSWANRV